MAQMLVVSQFRLCRSHIPQRNNEVVGRRYWLDEPLTHLDSSGCDSGKLLRKMFGGNSDHGTFSRQSGGHALSTILVILQDIAAEEIEECFDYIDEEL